MYRHAVSQDAIIQALRGKIEHALDRPRMYVGDSVEGLNGLLVAYVDALAMACSGYAGGFVYGQLPQVDLAKTPAENTAALVSAVKKILAEVPPA